MSLSGLQESTRMNKREREKREGEVGREGDGRTADAEPSERDEIMSKVKEE